MKILQINNYHYIRGGSDRMYLATSRLLEERGHSVVHFSVKDDVALDSRTKGFFVEPPHFYESAGFIRRLFSVFRFFYSREARRKLTDLIRREKPDVAHLHIFYGRLTSSILPVLKEYRIPAVMTIHDYRLLCPTYLLLSRTGNICEHCAAGGFFRCTFKKCNRGNPLLSFLSSLECYFRDLVFPYDRYVSTFIFVSKFVMNKHLQYKPGLSRKAVHLYNFVPVPKTAPVPGHEGYFFYCGRLAREKGILDLLESWRLFPQLKLKIAGEGDLKTSIEQYLDKYRMRNVELLGHLSGQRLQQLFEKAKFTIVPTRSYETFGLSIVESFLAGTPVIASNIGAIPELVRDGVNGFLFTASDGVSLQNTIKIAENMPDGQYRDMSMAAFTIASRQFNPEAYYRDLMQIYGAVLRESIPASG